MLDELQLNFEKSVEDNNLSSKELEIKKLNFDNFLKNGFPNKRLEGWKFIDLNQILKSEFKNFNFQQDLIDANEEYFKIIKEFEHNQIFLLDGVFFKSNFQFEDIEKIKISNEKYYDEQINENSLVNLNHAFVKKRLKVEVLSGYKANKPLIIYSNISDKSKSSIINSNIELVLGEDSSLEKLHLESH